MRARLLLALALLPDQAGAQTIDRLDAIAPYIDICVTAGLKREGIPGRHDATLRLAFRRDGSIIGEPRVSYSAPSREAPEQRRFIDTMIAAFRKCAPLPFSRALGSAIAGKIFTFRYTLIDQKDQEI